MRMRSELILVHEKSMAIPVADGNKFLSSCKEANGLTSCKYKLTKKTLLPTVINCLLTYLISAVLLLLKKAGGAIICNTLTARPKDKY